MNITDLTGRIESSYNKIIRLYQSVPVKDLLEPSLTDGWSPKDILAHIAVWEWRCAGMLERAHETNMPFRANPDVDALNQEFYEERRDWSWEEVAHDLREAHDALLWAIRDLPPERLNDEVTQRTIAEETWEHYEDHLVELRRWHQRTMSNEVNY